MHRFLGSLPLVLLRVGLVGLLGAVLSGCSEDARVDLAEQLKQGADAVAQTAEQASKQAAEQAVAVTEQATAIVDATELQLQLDAPEPLVADVCYSEWLTFSDGRPSVLQLQSYSVLQLQSYSEPERETFPAVFLRAVVPGATEVPYGQTVTAKLFVQAAANGAIYHTPDDQWIELSIGDRGETTTATITGGTLQRGDNGAAVPVTGRFVFGL